MNLYLANWEWRVEGGGLAYWVAPHLEKCVGCLDLRSAVQAGKAGGTPEGYGLFGYSEPISDSALVALPPLTDYLSVAARDFIKTYLKPPDSVPNDRFATVLQWLLVIQADPTGQMRWRAIRGSPGNGIKLYLGNQLIWSEAFSAESWAWPATLSVFQLDYKRLREVCLASGSERYRRFLSAASQKYRVPWETLLAGAGLPMEPPLPHETTISDNFNRADADALGTSSEGWSWTEVEGDVDIVSNQARSTTLGAPISARADSDLASDDHYVQSLVDVSEEANQAAGGVIARKDGTATLTYYIFRAVFHLNVLRFYKYIGATATQLGSDIPYTLSAGTPVTLKGTVNDSALEIFVNGASQGTRTDTAITGNLRTGIEGRKSTTGYVVWDDFQAGDLSAPPLTARSQIMISGK